MEFVDKNGARWVRRAEEDFKPFRVEVHVEGYRTHLDVWLHETRQFDTLAEAIEFVESIKSQSRVMFAEWVKWDYSGTNWYGINLHSTRIAEQQPVYIWERASYVS